MQVCVFLYGCIYVHVNFSAEISSYLSPPAFNSHQYLIVSKFLTKYGYDFKLKGLSFQAKFKPKLIKFHV